MAKGWGLFWGGRAPPRLKLKIFFLSFDLIRPKHKAQMHVKSKDDASNPCSEISNLADGLIFLELFFFFTSFSFRTMMSWSFFFNLLATAAANRTLYSFNPIQVFNLAKQPLLILKNKEIIYIYIYIYIKDLAWNLVFLCGSVALLERETREKNHVWKRKTRFLKKIMQNYIYYMQGQEYEYVFRLIWFFFFFPHRDKL